MKWEVDIIGDPGDLRMLSEGMRSGNISICEREGEFVLRSTQFDSFQDANDVRTYAQQIVSSLSGYSRLVLGAHKPIKVGSVVIVRDDGTKNVFVQLEPLTIRARVSLPSVAVTRADGTVEHHRPADSVEDWLEAAKQNPAVAKALRLRNADSLSWVELCRIYEVVEGDADGSHIVTSGREHSEIARFTHTANSVGACGDQARHGKETTQPPKNPISLSQARSLIDRLLKTWIARKAVSVRNGQHAS